MAGEMTSSEYLQHHLTHWAHNLSPHSGSDFWTLHVDTLAVSWVVGLLFLFVFRFFFCVLMSLWAGFGDLPGGCWARFSAPEKLQTPAHAP